MFFQVASKAMAAIISAAASAAAWFRSLICTQLWDRLVSSDFHFSSWEYSFGGLAAKSKDMEYHSVIPNTLNINGAPFFIANCFSFFKGGHYLFTHGESHLPRVRLRRFGTSRYSILLGRIGPPTLCPLDRVWKRGHIANPNALFLLFFGSPEANAASILKKKLSGLQLFWV